jgi:hypothetical protein
VVVVGGRVGDDAVGRRADLVVPHVGIVGGKQDTDVPHHAGKNDPPRA